MLDDEGLDVLQVGDAMRRPRGEFFVSNEDERFLLAAKSARLKAASDKSWALTPVAEETTQAPSTPRSMFICMRLSVASTSTQPPTLELTAPPTINEA